MAHILALATYGGRPVTKTPVEFHPHRDAAVPCCGYQSDVLRFDWRNQRMLYHGVLIAVSYKYLKIIKNLRYTLLIH